MYSHGPDLDRVLKIRIGLEKFELLASETGIAYHVFVKYPNNKDWIKVGDVYNAFRNRQKKSWLAVLYKDDENEILYPVTNRVHGVETLVLLKALEFGFFLSDLDCNEAEFQSLNH